MNRYHLAPTSMRVLLVFSLLLTFVSIEQNAAPPVAQAATPVSISAGGDHTCAVKSDGTLACWGKSDNGQATPPAGSFTQVSAGNFHTCAVKSDGTLACWGDNTYGQATPPVGSFTQVSAGGFHTCGLKSDATVACWGFSAYGQTTPPAGSFTQVSAGYRHTCGLKSDATLACWGDNNDGQATPPAGTFTQVSAGFSHTCGLKSDSSVACWGLNENGQATPPAGAFTQLDAGSYHNCGLKSNATLACWGNNDFGQTAPPASSFTQLDTGANHSCGLRSDGTGICWGLNLDGQAPSQVSITSTDLPTVNVGVLPPTLVGAGGLGGPYTFTVVSGTLPTGLTLNSNGTWAWNNPTGWGDYSFSIKAIDKSGILGVVQPFTLHVLNTSTAITSDTPDPSTVGQAVPVQYAVTPLNAGTPTGNVTVVVVQQALRFIQISAGERHTCALKADRSLACWGSDSDGQATPPAGAFAQVSAGGFHTCGVKADSTVVCWGDNSFGQATPPDGTISNSAETCTAAVSAGGCAVSFTSVGLKYLRATYPGDAAFSGSVSALIAHSVKAATTTTIAGITPGPVEAGPTVLVHYTVAGTVLDIPSGMVTVRAGADSCTAPATAGVCRLTFTSAGVKSLTATYAGDSAFDGSVSAPIAHTVKATTTTISSVTPSPAGAKRTVLVRYTVAGAVQGIPGGMVTVRAGADTCTAPAAAGACLLTFTSAGVKSLTATYAGDSALYGSVSAAVAYTVTDRMVVFLPLSRR